MRGSIDAFLLALQHNRYATTSLCASDEVNVGRGVIDGIASK